MKITIVMGYAHLMPPDAGEDSARAWQQLALEFAKRGHEVSIVSRRWRGTPAREERDGVLHLRLPGYDQTRRALKNHCREFLWSRRVCTSLPAADVTVVVGSGFLPGMIRLLRRKAGGLVFMPANPAAPALRACRRADTILAVSSPMRRSIVEREPKLATRIQIVGYPIDWSLFSRAKLALEPEDPVTIGYVGRIHREKGMDVFASAIEHLRRLLPSGGWRIVLTKMRESSTGGASEVYATAIERRIVQAIGRDRFVLRPPALTQERLAASYDEIDIFCYPTLMRRREPFCQPVVEAMASGAVPVAADLPCLYDCIEPGKSGELFDPYLPDSGERLAAHLHRLIVNRPLRLQMSEAARLAAYRYDYQLLASRLLADFATLAVART